MLGGLNRGPALPKYPRPSNKDHLNPKQLPPRSHLLAPADSIGLKENFNRVLVQVRTLLLLLKVAKVFALELVLLGLQLIPVKTLRVFQIYPGIQ
jgi:hypothetical protein